MAPSIRHKISRATLLLGLSALMVLLVGLTGQPADAGQGCPFDDGSCREYCNQQGCNMGYCGHFAWIQCICRKCGDEWNYYDKVRYNPDKAVNQTELDSLKLNGTSPLILVSNSVPATGNQQQLQQADKKAQPVGSTGGLKHLLSSQISENQQRQQQQQQVAENKTKPATLTTLLIPDLSDSSKIDLNDIPDENSDKFLDFLAKNHEKLVQATSAESQTGNNAGNKNNNINNGDQNDDSNTSDDSEAETEPSTTTTSPTSTMTTILASGDDETVEIRISSSNNNLRIGQEQRQQVFLGE